MFSLLLHSCGLRSREYPHSSHTSNINSSKHIFLHSSRGKGDDSFSSPSLNISTLDNITNTSYTMIPLLLSHNLRDSDDLVSTSRYKTYFQTHF
jgi:hypothetical protein